jgi:hypothetical protein
MSLHNSFVRATVYSLDGGGSNPGRDTIFLFTGSIPALGPTQPSVRSVPVVCFPGGKAALP